MFKIQRLILLFFLFAYFFLPDIYTKAENEVAGSIATEEGLEYLLLQDIPIVVASLKPLNVRTSPGIISIVTSEDIARSGARDLIDILRLVPGFYFAEDIENVVDIGIRGSWAHEGKVLMLLDGQELNEDLYSNLFFGNHYPVDLIEKIEIIRGPGSAIYGGYAELGVINILSRSPKKTNECFVSGTYGRMETATGRKNLTLYYGTKKEDFSFSISGFTGQAIRSDRTFTDFYGNSFDMEGYSDIRPLLLNLGVNYSGINFRAIMDRYELNDRTMYYVAAPDDVKSKYYSDLYELSYEWKISDQFTLTPKIGYKKNLPWSSTEDKAKEFAEENPLAYEIYFKIRSEKELGAILGSWDLNEDVNILLGIEQYHLKAVDMLESKATNKTDSGFQGEDEVSYNNFSVYSQGLFKFDWANITIGERYNKNSDYDSSSVPRFAITKATNYWHCKILASKAFRSPSIQNITLFRDIEGNSTRIKPETTTIYEIEGGVRPTEDSYLTMNLFDIRISDPIVYYYDETDSYTNYSKTGTKGIEFTAKMNRDKFNVNFSYSFYRANDNEVEQYKVPQDENLFLGFPAHKLTLSSELKAPCDFIITPSIIYNSKRFGGTGVTEDDSLIIGEYDAVTLLNLSFLSRNFLSKGWEINFSIFNITNKKDLYIEPYYDGYHAPLPGPSREFVLKVTRFFD